MDAARGCRQTPVALSGRHAARSSPSAWPKGVDDGSLEVAIRAASSLAQTDGELGSTDRAAVVAILQGGFTWLTSKDAQGGRRGQAEPHLRLNRHRPSPWLDRREQGT